MFLRGPWLAALWPFTALLSNPAARHLPPSLLLLPVGSFLILACPCSLSQPQLIPAETGRSVRPGTEALSPSLAATSQRHLSGRCFLGNGQFGEEDEDPAESSGSWPPEQPPQGDGLALRGLNTWAGQAAGADSY